MKSPAAICVRNKVTINVLEKENKSVSKEMRVGTASTYFEITCFGTAFEQPSGASN
jgi:hypothetical protein